MSDALYLVAGVAILLAALLPSVLSRLAISPPIVLLAAGMAIGLLPVGGDDLLDPIEHRAVVEQVTQFAVLLALMGVGLALDRPLRLRRPRDWLRWAATWRLLLVAMPVSIAAVWLLGWWGLGLGPATALLLGAVLAPTDPVLAGDVQVGAPDVARSRARGRARGRTRERRAARGPVRTHLGGRVSTTGSPSRSCTPRSTCPRRARPSSWIVQWIAWELVGKVVVGFLVGALVGWLLAKLAFRARRASLRLAEQGEPLLALAALATSFGAAELVGGYGFIAVFTCGMAIRNAERSHDYNKEMHGVVERLERLFTLLVLLCLGMAMSRGLLDALDWRGVLAGVALIVLIRPLIGALSLMPFTPKGPRDEPPGARGGGVLRRTRGGVAVLPGVRRRARRVHRPGVAVGHSRVHHRALGARARRAGQAGDGLAGARHGRWLG